LQNNTGLLRSHLPAQQEKLAAYEAIHPDLGIFAYSSATYTPTAPGIVHAGLGSLPYTHASSPLRRYADLINQRALKAILKEKTWTPTNEAIATHLNAQQKKQKYHDRDFFFLKQMIQSNIGKRVAIVLTSTDEKTKVFVPAWKRIVTVRQGSIIKLYSQAQEVFLEYYADLQKPKWEERMVFHLIERPKVSEY
jgi:exoribonuclease R